MDIIPTTEKTKDGEGSSVKCPMLNATNYTVWTMKMKAALKVHEAWEAIETTGEVKAKKNDLAFALLLQSIPESLALQVGELESAKKIWEAIKTRHIGAERVKEARLQTLTMEFDRLRMKETDSIDDFGGKLAELASQSASLGVVIEEVKLVKKFLMSLPSKKYIQIVATLEQFLDLKTTSFEDKLGRLKVYEGRLRAENQEEEDKGKLLWTNNEGQSSRHQGDQSARSYSDGGNRDYNNSYRGRGRGRSFYRARGRGRYNGGRSYNAGRDESRDASHITCFRCDKVGHFVAQCPELLLKLQETVETEATDTQEADELLMHEIVFLNEKKVKYVLEMIL
ncbi:uncharacterized protein LOC108850681 [Raphanus sativus]|uniref:Uncharacterized protein LOC108850681 n=1 Tax=Raphanus sativus TaxID=3726 RepID=A0A9W3DK98_RAPSA|nr:uncharacterized protein LOC108850681 [Raphanus sativus]